MNETYDYAVLAGGGQLPLVVLNEILSHKNSVLVISFTGQPQPDLTDFMAAGEDILHITHPLGAAGKTIKLLKQYNVQHVVLAGNLSKPNLLDLKPDATGLALLAKLSRRHDNDYLSLVENVLKKEGFHVQGVQEICPNLCPDAKFINGLTGRNVDKTELADITHGVGVLGHMAPLDVGQACVVKDGVVLGVEAVEGTDTLLARCADLRGKTAHNGGILVKMSKTGQTQKADLPTIGPKTLEMLIQHGYAGVAIEAEKTILLEPETLKKMAKTANIFIKAIES